jgi:signal transduction histidine kinase
VINDVLDYSRLEADAFELDPAPFDPRLMAEGAARHDRRTVPREGPRP